MTIRPATGDDLDAVAALLEDAFGRPDEARLVRALWAGDDLAVTLISVAESGIAAVAVLSHLSAPRGALGLGPLAVARLMRDQGLGKALIGASVDWARREGHAAVFVLGQPAYYTRFGFSVEAARPFTSPYPADYMMVLELRPGALAGGGEIRYPPAFAALG